MSDGSTIRSVSSRIDGAACSGLLRHSETDPSTCRQTQVLVAGERSLDEPGHDVSDVGDAQTVLDLLFHGAPHSRPRDSAFANYTGAPP